MPKKRNLNTFEAEDEVQEMIAVFRSFGGNLTETVNDLLRSSLPFRLQTLVAERLRETAELKKKYQKWFPEVSQAELEEYERELASISQGEDDAFRQMNELYDQFTKAGMNWASELVRRRQRLLQSDESQKKLPPPPESPTPDRQSSEP